MYKRHLAKIVKNRFRSPNELQTIFAEARQHHPVNEPKYLKGLHNGIFYRIRVPPPPRVASGMQSSTLPTPPAEVIATEAFQGINVGQAAVAESARQHQQTGSENLFQRTLAWLKTNWSILMMNLGAVCVLAGYTRSDVVELRSFFFGSSLCNVIAQLGQRPIRIMPILWPSISGSVNLFFITRVLEERHSSVRLTQQQEDVYIKYFLPHGMTPKQFVNTYDLAELKVYPKGSTIIHPGHENHHVYLIIHGKTIRNLHGRKLLEISSAGDGMFPNATAGDWYGEMCFLEEYGIKQQEQLQSHTATPPASNASLGSRNQGPIPDNNDSSTPHSAPSIPASLIASRHTFRPRDVPAPEPMLKTAVSALEAEDDVTVLRWTHADMEQLMARSTDLRAALTRAMTAAICGKVINLSVSEHALISPSSPSAAPPWSSWLHDWKHSAGTVHVSVKTEDSNRKGKWF